MFSNSYAGRNLGIAYFSKIMPDELTNIIIQILLGLLIISTLLGVFRWKFLPMYFRVIVGYLFWNLMVEGLIYAIPSGTNNLPLLHFHTLVEFAFFSFVYKEIGLFRNWKEKSFWISLAVVSGLIILNSVFIQSIFEYNSFAKTLVQTILIGYAVAYLFRLEEEDQASQATMILNISVLLFYSGSLFIFMFGNILLKNEYMSLFWDINLILNIVFQILMFVAIWKVSGLRRLPF